MTAIADKPATAGLQPPRHPNAPTDWDDHQRRMAELRQKQDANRMESLRCTDPDYAARIQAAKPRYEYEVQCEFVRNGKAYDLTEKVTAQNEQDAWSMFCYKIGQNIGPRDGIRRITKLRPAK